MRGLYGLGAWREFRSVPRRRFGVPSGGAWDRESAQITQALAKKGLESPVYELLQGTVELEILEPGVIAVVGIGSVTLAGQRHPAGVRLPVYAGDLITVQAHVAYATHSSHNLSQARLDWHPAVPSSLRYLPSGDPIGGLSLRVSPASSRTGVRLIGLPPAALVEQPSEPSCVGAIQRTPGGELIVIGPDGPTIGGYPKIGCLIEGDLDLIPRLRVEQTIQLKPVSLDEASAISWQNRSNVQSLLRNLQLLS